MGRFNNRFWRWQSRHRKTNTAKLYKNGKEEDAYWDGLIDEVLIYNYVHISLRIQQDYLEGTTAHLELIKANIKSRV